LENMLRFLLKFVERTKSPLVNPLLFISNKADITSTDTNTDQRAMLDPTKRTIMDINSSLPRIQIAFRINSTTLLLASNNLHNILEFLYFFESPVKFIATARSQHRPFKRQQERLHIRCRNHLNLSLQWLQLDQLALGNFSLKPELPTRVVSTCKNLLVMG
jgi:hypothetical protein